MLNRPGAGKRLQLSPQSSQGRSQFSCTRAPCIRSPSPPVPRRVQCARWCGRGPAFRASRPSVPYQQVVKSYSLIGSGLCPEFGTFLAGAVGGSPYQGCPNFHFPSGGPAGRLRLPWAREGTCRRCPQPPGRTVLFGRGEETCFCRRGCGSSVHSHPSLQGRASRLVPGDKHPEKPARGDLQKQICSESPEREKCLAGGPLADRDRAGMWQPRLHPGGRGPERGRGGRQRGGESAKVLAVARKVRPATVLSTAVPTVDGGEVNYACLLCAADGP